MLRRKAQHGHPYYIGWDTEIFQCNDVFCCRIGREAIVSIIVACFEEMSRWCLAISTNSAVSLTSWRHI